MSERKFEEKEEQRLKELKEMEIKRQKEYMKNQIKILKERTMNLNSKKKEPEEEEDESPKRKYKKNLLKYEKIKGLAPLTSSFLRDSAHLNLKLKSPVAQHQQSNTSMSKMLELPPSDLESFRRRNRSEHDLVSSISSKSFRNVQKKLPIQKDHQKYNSTGGAGYGAFFTENSRKSSFGQLKYFTGLKTMETIESTVDDDVVQTPCAYWQRAPEQEEEKYYDAWLDSSENHKPSPFGHTKQKREEFNKLKKKVRSFYEKMVGFHKEHDVKKIKNEVKNNFAVIDDDMRLKNEILFRFDEHLEREMVKELLQDKANYL
jgi:hypothetical protein